MMANPYAPPRAAVQDMVDPLAVGVPADRGTRLGAAMLDGLIFMLMVYLPFFVTVGLGAAASSALGNEGTRTLLAGGGLLVLAGFGVWLFLTVRYIKRNGQSIGKKLLGIKVVRSDGSPISFGRLFWLRNVVNWIISIVPLYGIVDLLFIFAESRQCIHDKLADTIVVKA